MKLSRETPPQIRTHHFNVLKPSAEQNNPSRIRENTLVPDFDTCFISETFFILMDEFIHESCRFSPSASGNKVYL